MLNTSMSTSKLTPEAKVNDEILRQLRAKFGFDEDTVLDQSLLLTTSGLQLQMRQFFLNKSEEFMNPILVTLTFKNPPYKDEIIRSLYERFLERLSKRCFKNAYRRYKKRVVQPIAVWERDENTRLNIHAVFECPEKFEVLDFQTRIDAAWVYGTVKFQDSYVHSERGLSDWINYMCKFRSKDLNERSILDYMLV